MTTAQFVNFYEILQIAQTASEEEVRKAITQQRRQWVKRQASADPQRRAEAETRVRDIDRAEKVLCNSGGRAAFDRELADYRPPAVDQSTTDDRIDWLERARAYLGQDNPAAANYAAREAINQRSNDDDAWFLRGHSSFLLGNSQDAEYEFSEAIRLQPQTSLYYYGLAEVYAAQEKWRSALTKYQDALRLDPGNPEYETSIAQVYLENDRAGEALEIMRKVVRAHPDNQVFKYYLAIAVHNNALGSLGKVNQLVYNGEVFGTSGYYIVSEEQAALMDSCADEMERLRVGDPDIAQLITNAREMVAEARAYRWELTGSKPWVIAFVILGLIPLFTGGGSGSGGPALFGVLAGVVIAVLYVIQHRRPNWKHRLVSFTQFNRLERRGI